MNIIPRRVGPGRIVSASVATAFAATAAADVTLPAILADHMVVQRQTAAPIWGWARAGERVRVSADWPGGSAVEAVADDRGRWSLNLKTPVAGGPYTITVVGDNALTIKDVLVGEVWVCGGQSNMEWTVASSYNPAGEAAGAKYPMIRCFDVPNVASAEARDDCAGAWKGCSPMTVSRFSAAAYFFAREVHRELGVPVGIVTADWGGTVIQAWMNEESLADFPEFSEALGNVRAERKDPGAAERRYREQLAAWWRAWDEPGAPAADWAALGYDDAAWKSMKLPAAFGAAHGLDRFDGMVYYRRSVDLAPGWGGGKDATLLLGPIDDRDAAYVNGELIGSTHEDGRWNQARRYTIPARLIRPGRNVIALRVLDTGGLGGVNGAAESIVLAPSAGGESPARLGGDWRYAVGRTMRDAPGGNRGLPPAPSFVGINPNTPTVLHNGMIAPIERFARRGFLWYQGESNRYDAKQYARLFPSLIGRWRGQTLGEGPVAPFYFVQIAPFRYGGDNGETAALREAQAAALRLPDTGMVVTTDIGNPQDIHPVNKQDVGRRLALLALSKTYGKTDVESSGPMFKSFQKQSGAIRVAFDHANGLMSRDGPPGSFIVAGADRRFFKARAAIDGDTIVVSSPRVPSPEAVRFAWEPAPEPNLVNDGGLPAAPFRTDDWNGPTGPVEDDGRTSHLTTEPAFTPLFSGTDLAGWVNVNCAPGTWTARDGVIACTGFPTGVIRTTKQYENFVLELEWRHLKPQGNAGLFVWSDALTARGQPFTRSVEVQVMDGLEGEWYTSDGDIFPIHGATMVPENGRGGNRAFPTEKRMNPSPEWNHYRVTCLNGDVSLAVNGSVVTRGRECSPRQGHICLEAEGSPIEFRNLLLRELPPTPGLPSNHIADATEGFMPLYTGVDFAGWKFGPEHEGHFKAADWTIDFDGQGADLWTHKSYKDFVLIADWRWSGELKPAHLPVILPNGDEKKDASGKTATQTVPEAGDSGIYLRGSSKAQVNTWCWPVGSGEIYGYRTDAALPPEVRAGATPRVNADAPIGQWNRFVVTMRGDRLTVVLNGKTVIENAHLPGIAESGPIALQMHGGAIQFANLLIKELE
ncbi:MAG: family 16 glycoside hydrolase [Phycisphaerales bacterium]